MKKWMIKFSGDPATDLVCYDLVDPEEYVCDENGCHCGICTVEDLEVAKLISNIPILYQLLQCSLCLVSDSEIKSAILKQIPKIPGFKKEK